MNEPYIGGYEMGFGCDCDERDVGNPYFETGNLHDGSTVTCPYCGATYRINITEVEGGDED